MAVVPSRNTAPCIAKIIPPKALMEKAMNRTIVIRFSASLLVKWKGSHYITSPFIYNAWTLRRRISRYHLAGLP